MAFHLPQGYRYAFIFLRFLCKTAYNILLSAMQQMEKQFIFNCMLWVNVRLKAFINQENTFIPASFQ